MSLVTPTTQISIILCWLIFVRLSDKGTGLLTSLTKLQLSLILLIQQQLSYMVAQCSIAAVIFAFAPLWLNLRGLRQTRKSC